MEDIFLKLMFNILKIYMMLTMIYHFCLKEWKLKKNEKLVAILHGKIEYVIHIRNLKKALNHGLVLKWIELLNLIKKLG